MADGHHGGREELADKYNILPDGQVLLDAMVNAKRAAQATQQKKKITALKNAVVAPRSAGRGRAGQVLPLGRPGSAPSTSSSSGFLEEPEVAFNPLGLMWPSGPHDSDARLGELLDHVVPGVANRHDWRDLVVDDLAGARVVVMFSSVDDMWVLPALSQSFVTELERRFLRFVSESE